MNEWSPPMPQLKVHAAGSLGCWPVIAARTSQNFARSVSIALSTLR